MARVLNTAQPTIVRGVSPAPAYSRVISLGLVVPGDGVWRYWSWPSVGDRVRLLGVQVWVLPKAINVSQGTAFRLYAGSGDAGSVAALGSWDSVLPIWDQASGQSVWTLHDGRQEMEWWMNKLFTGEARRFAIVVMRGVGQGNDALYCSLTISEG